jgi:hypothetical protein
MSTSLPSPKRLRAGRQIPNQCQRPNDEKISIRTIEILEFTHLDFM